MGGSGSGSGYRWNKKELTMEQKRIDISWMKKQNCLRPGVSGSLSWSCRGKNIGSIGFRMEADRMILNYRHKPRGGDREDVEQNISFDRTPCNYGGHRKWFLCPRCYKRVAILYGAGKYFFCRHCYQLTYNSCNESPLQRILDKSYKIKKRLGGESGISSPVPDRPKGMHHRTYFRMKAEIYRLENLGEMGMIEKWGFGF